MVDLHEGTITAASEGPGRGARFTVTLDAMETSLLDGPARLLDDTQPGARPGAEILLVEDHEDTAKVLRRILGKAGYIVRPAVTVAAARQVADERKVDLVISDLGLPDGSGLELMRQLSHSHGLRGIALSGFGTEEDVAASRAAGFAEHLTKPVDWEQLKLALARLLDGDR